MTDDEISTAFEPLWSDVRDGDSFPHSRPLLAHYTSIATLERIMANDELWFSNPLFMNDLDELRFGMSEGAREFRASQELRDVLGEKRSSIVHEVFEDYFTKFSGTQALDVYVLCFSEHDASEGDGLLSMWRGYGGNGNGAAIIVDTGKFEPVEASPIIVSRVEYLTAGQRIGWIKEKLSELAKLFREVEVPDDKLHIPVWSFFERLKIFSIFTKHCGFKEEQEWRAVYLRERDESKALDEMLGYAVGSRGVEPKLKLKVQPIEGVTAAGFCLENIVKEIILGPAVSSHLAISAVGRMLDSLGKRGLAKSISASSTPYRSG